MNIFDTKNNFEWRDYLKILKRRKWYFILTFSLILSLGVLKIVMKVPVYESSSTLQVQPSKLLSSSLRRVVPGVIGSERAETLKKQILSSEYLLQLIYRLDLHKEEKIRERAKVVQASFPDKNLQEIIELLLINKLKENIKVRIFGGDVIEIKTAALTPDLAYLIVKTLTDIFIDESLRRELGSVQSALRFNDEQIAIFKEKLDQAENRLERYKRNLITHHYENQTLSSAALESMNEAIVAIGLNVKEKRDHLSYISSQLRGRDSIDEYPETLTIQKILGEIDEKVAQMASLMKRYSWNSAEVIRINRNINQSREKIKHEIERLFGVIYPNTNAQTLSLFSDKAITLVDLEILKRKKEALNQILETFKSKASQSPAKEMELSKLEEEVAINRRIYNMFLEQNQGTQIEEAMQQADASSRFKILEPPRKPLEPINAGFRMMLMITIVVASSLGAGVVYLREYLDNSIRTVQEAEEYFEIPVISVIPNLNHEAEKLQRK